MVRARIAMAAIVKTVLLPVIIFTVSQMNFFVPMLQQTLAEL
jgi:hypothetical protein